MDQGRLVKSEKFKIKVIIEHSITFQPQTCNNKGFSSVTGREYDHVWWGILNAKTQCIDSALEVEAGIMEYGEWNYKLSCKTNERLVGFHVRQDKVYTKLVNFRAQCGTIPN